MQRLTDGDKTFLKAVEAGTKPSPAFREAYPEHPAVIRYLRSESGSPDRQKASEALKDAAKTKLKANYINNALKTYRDKMDEFSDLSVNAAIDLVKNARSEKVRADLAIEGMRHKVGSPTVKVHVQEEKRVILTFEKPKEVQAPLRQVIDVEPSAVRDAPSDMTNN